MLSNLISLIFPQNCINCQQSLIVEERFICTKCKLDLPLTNDHSYHDNPLFQKLAFESKIISANSYLYFYKGGISQKILHELKYQGKKELGILMGEWFASSLTNLDVDMIVPVPLHKSKQMKRGYNQSEYFALGIGAVKSIPIRTDLAARMVSKKTQTKKSRIQRWSDMENVYSEVGEDLTNKKILVVDDVITTGATIGMLCERLIEAHVNEIHIATIARGK